MKMEIESEALKELETNFQLTEENVRKLVTALNSDRNGRGYLEELTYSWSKNEGFEFGGYTFKYKQSYGGEGQGDEYWAVFSAEKEGEETRYFEVPGWYASHQGGVNGVTLSK